MATTNELLEEMEAEMLTGENDVFAVDNNLRTVSIPESMSVLGVEHDDDVHRLYFQIPKMYGDTDLSNFDIRINYMNAAGDGDVYAVTDKEVSGDNITFSWLVGRHAFAQRGDVIFIVCLKQMDDEGNVIKEFNTTVTTLPPVLEGLETSELVIQDNPDIIEQILTRLDDLEENGGGGGGGDYTLPQATANTLGGVKADPKTNNDTVPAKIGSDGKMYVQKYPTSLPASDVKSWAKADEKPEYTAEEVGALPAETQIPKKLPNPHKLIFSGAVTGEYDGSAEKTINIPQSSGGGDYILPQATESTLGGIKADPATEEDTVPARIGEDGKLYVKSYPEGGGNADNGVPAGGSTGQMLVKKSDSDNDVEWKTPLTAAEVAEVVMENYLEIIDSINGEAVYTTDDLETDLDTVNGEVI